MNAGERIGPFVLIKKDKGDVIWARCIHCGKERFVRKSNAARAKSCGCKTRDILRAARTKHGHSRHRGHPSGSPTYETWHSMKLRCENPNHSNFEHYGAQGVKVCERWQKFENFLADMGERPMGKTLDRYPNQEGNYEPGNCRWADATEQANNRRSNRHLTHDGKTMTIAEWAREIGINVDTLWNRVHAGWTIERALTEPTRQRAA
jgi:hypothetical protein